MYFWLWLIVMLLSIIVEIMTATSLICIWFAPGALAGMVANHYNLSFIKQIENSLKSTANNNPDNKQEVKTGS